MTDAMFSGLEDKLAHYTVANAMPKRVGNAHPMIAPYDTFKTQDGFVAFGVSTDAQWEKFCLAIDKRRMVTKLLSIKVMNQEVIIILEI